MVVTGFFVLWQLLVSAVCLSSLEPNRVSVSHSYAFGSNLVMLH